MTKKEEKVLLAELDRIGKGELTDPEEESLGLLAELEKLGIATKTALILPPDLPFDQYEAMAAMIGEFQRQSTWLLGDLLNYGEKVYGETYSQAAAATGLAEQTLMNYASVCGRVPRSRRIRGLAFSIHAEVASLPAQEQTMWLKRAVKEGWSRGRIREELSIARGRIEIPPPPAREIGTGFVPDAPVDSVFEPELGQPDRNGSPQLRTAAPTEVLPPAVGEVHICQCVACGRYHRTDQDVVELEL